MLRLNHAAEAMFCRVLQTTHVLIPISTLNGKMHDIFSEEGIYNYIVTMLDVNKLYDQFYHECCTAISINHGWNGKSFARRKPAMWHYWLLRYFYRRSQKNTRQLLLYSLFFKYRGKST